MSDKITSNELLENYDIDLIQIKNQSDISLIGVVKITNELYGRIDKLILRYYNGKMKYLQPLMDFNGITDPIELKLGTFFKLPIISELEESLKINSIQEDNIIPGILSSTNSKIINSKNKGSNNKTNTTALPKLKITLNKVNYDSSSGILTL
jgi:hypothetical protein